MQSNQRLIFVTTACTRLLCVYCVAMESFLNTNEGMEDSKYERNFFQCVEAFLLKEKKDGYIRCLHLVTPVEWRLRCTETSWCCASSRGKASNCFCPAMAPSRPSMALHAQGFYALSAFVFVVRCRILYIALYRGYSTILSCEQDATGIMLTV